MGVNNGSRVAAAKPKAGGGLYWAPDGTPLPTDATTALDAACKCLGAVSAEGVKPGRNTNSEKVREWDGSVLANLLTEEDRTFEFKLLSVLDRDVLDFIFGTANVTVTPPAGAAGTKIATVDKGGKPEKGVLIMEMIYGGVKQRKVVPIADPTVTGEDPYIPGGLRGFTVEVEATKDDDGAFVYEYDELDDAA